MLKFAGNDVPASLSHFTHTGGRRVEEELLSLYLLGLEDMAS